MRCVMYYIDTDLRAQAYSLLSTARVQSRPEEKHSVAESITEAHMQAGVYIDAKRKSFIKTQIP